MNCQCQLSSPDLMEDVERQYLLPIFVPGWSQGLKTCSFSTLLRVPLDRNSVAKLLNQSMGNTQEDANKTCYLSKLPSDMEAVSDKSKVMEPPATKTRTFLPL